MYNSIEKLKEKQAEEMEKLQKEIKLMELMQEEKLPLPNNTYMRFNEPWLVYEVDTFSQAISIVNKFNLIDYGIYRNGTTSIKSLNHYSEKESSKIDYRFNFPYLNLGKYSFKEKTENTLIFWTVVGETVVKVRIEIKQGVNLIKSVTGKGANKRIDINCPVRGYAHCLRYSTCEENSAKYCIFWHDLEMFKNSIGNIMEVR